MIFNVWRISYCKSLSGTTRWPQSSKLFPRLRMSGAVAPVTRLRSRATQRSRSRCQGPLIGVSDAAKVFNFIWKWTKTRDCYCCFGLGAQSPALASWLALFSGCSCRGLGASCGCIFHKYSMRFPWPVDRASWHAGGDHPLQLHAASKCNLSEAKLTCWHAEAGQLA